MLGSWKICHIKYLPSQDLHGKDTRGIKVTCRTALCMQALSAESSEGEETNSVAHAADEDKMAVSTAPHLTSTGRLFNKIAIITGSSSGIGRTIALALDASEPRTPMPISAKGASRGEGTVTEKSKEGKRP